jgi:hypothetical protein
MVSLCQTPLWGEVAKQSHQIGNNMSYTQHSTAGVDIAPGQSESEVLIPSRQRRRRPGIRGWLAIMTLIGVSFASYGGMLYLFDTYIKGETGAFTSTALR